jgi:hypothetical protein
MVFERIFRAAARLRPHPGAPAAPSKGSPGGRALAFRLRRYRDGAKIARHTMPSRHRHSIDVVRAKRLGRYLCRRPARPGSDAVSPPRSSPFGVGARRSGWSRICVQRLGWLRNGAVSACRLGRGPRPRHGSRGLRELAETLRLGVGARSATRSTCPLARQPSRETQASEHCPNRVDSPVVGPSACWRSLAGRSG